MAYHLHNAVLSRLRWWLWRVLISCTLLSLLLVGFAFAWRYVVEEGNKSPPTYGCQANLKVLGVGLKMYVQDYDEVLPTARNWWDGLYPYIKAEGVLACPGDPIGHDSYAFNGLLNARGLVHIGVPADMPVFYDSLLHRRNGSDLLQSFAPRHDGKGTVAYADGHVRLKPDAPAANAGLKRVQ